MAFLGEILLFTVLLMVGLLAVIVLPLRLLDLRHLRRLREKGRTVNSYVTNLGENSGDGMSSPSYWAEVSWDADDGTFSARVTLSHKQYDSLRVGSRLTVAYMPGRERRARTLD